MADTGDRMDRAGRYVLGLMDDDERERAERDLEIDPAFRDAMVEVAERMHVFGSAVAPAEGPQDQWRQVKERIDAMPQMRRTDDSPGAAAHGKATVQGAPEKPVAFGRRKSDALTTTIEPASVRDFQRVGPGSMPDRRAVVLALCLVGAFALGYVVGVSSNAPSDAVDLAARP